MNKLLTKRSMALTMVLSLTFTTLVANDSYACGRLGKEFRFGNMKSYFGGYLRGKECQNKNVDNDVILQGFEWTLEDNGTLWNVLSDRATDLDTVGIDAVWLPPAYKGTSSSDVGYGPYDLYDLGEFDQQGTIRTKYGTKDEYISLVDTLHDNGIKAYADIVLNHKASAESTELVDAVTVNPTNRLENTSDVQQISAWTVFNYPGRNSAYSSFTWDASCFDGVDWDQNTSTSAIYRFADKTWDSNVSAENGNYDYLMYADVDFNNKAVVNELTKWGQWYVNTANLDGFRLDAVKHIDSKFYKKWLKNVSRLTRKNLFAVGEYYSNDTQELENYIDSTANEMSLFDFTLQSRFKAASDSNGSFDMSTLFEGTLSDEDSKNAVTFVENHDTQPGQSLEATVSKWFKPLAYTAILTRQEGTPCVFYGDYYGTADESIASYKSDIDELLLARKYCAFGKQYDYTDNQDIIGWTRVGNAVNKNSGLAALISDGEAGSIKMYVGKENARETWVDVTGNITESVKIDKKGYATFNVASKSHSVWVSEKSAAKIAEAIASLPEVAPANGVDPDNNKLTLYYATNWENANVHYQIGSNDWTEVPGVAMEDSDINGYKSITVDLGISKYFTCVFNNGEESWDNNNNNNYKLTSGTYYINAGSVNKGIPEAIEEAKDNKLTVYYYTGWETPHIHYQAGYGNWTDAPGMAMDKSEYVGYSKYTIELGSYTYVTACFNDGGSNWDSCYGNNYSLGTGIYTVKDGVTYANSPAELGAELDDGDSKDEEDIEVKTPAVKVYYYNTDWQAPYAHYGINNSNWTNAPGYAMTASEEYSGYYEYSFELGTGSYVMVCFNDNGNTWDSNGGSNYMLYNGTYTIKDGVITVGTPADAASLANDVTIYCSYTDWTTAYAHYALNCDWDNLTSDIELTNSVDYEGYLACTINLQGYSKLVACFNNGNGWWESNQGANYVLGTGTYTMVNGVMSAGTPN